MQAIFTRNAQRRVQCDNYFIKFLRFVTFSLNLKHCLKSIRYRSFCGPYFHVVRLKSERYGVPLRAQSECGKIRTRKTPNTDTFHAVYVSEITRNYEKRVTCLRIFREELCYNQLIIKQFVPNTSFLHPLKKQTALPFTDVFRGQRNVALGTNGLTHKNIQGI